MTTDDEAKRRAALQRVNSEIQKARSDLVKLRDLTLEMLADPPPPALADLGFDEAGLKEKLTAIDEALRLLCELPKDESDVLH